MIGMYVIPQTRGLHLERPLDNLKPKGDRRTLVTGDSNAMHKVWDERTNGRGRTLHKWTRRHNRKITETAVPSYIAKDRRGSGKPELMIDSARADVSQPRDDECDESSDHPPIMYTVKELPAVSSSF